MLSLLTVRLCLYMYIFVEHKVKKFYNLCRYNPILERSASFLLKSSTSFPQRRNHHAYSTLQSNVANLSDFKLSPEQTCKRNGRRHPAMHIGALAYADDICLLAESIDDVECSLHRLETSAAEIGITINYNKTKVMHLRQTSAPRMAIPWIAQSSTPKRMTLLKLVSADQL